MLIGSYSYESMNTLEERIIFVQNEGSTLAMIGPKESELSWSKKILFILKKMKSTKQRKGEKQEGN